MKIPTLLALVLLSIITVVGISTKSYLSSLIPTKIQSQPNIVTQSNLTPNSIFLSWQTKDQTPTQLIYTTDKNFFKDVKSLNDDRDLGQIKNYNLHLVTLQELQPNTIYYFKIGHQPLLGTVNKFTTPSNNSPPHIQPLVGSVTGSNLQPLSDVAVLITIDGYFPLLSFTNQTGNFILPINLLYARNNLAQTLDLSQNPDLTLTLSKDNQTSRINLKLGQLPTPLPPFILGQDLDLTNYQANNLANLNQPTPTPNFNFDVNGDGKINTLDLSTVQINIGKKKFNPKTDINLDGVVDQKDVDLIKGSLQTKP